MGCKNRLIASNRNSSLLILRFKRLRMNRITIKALSIKTLQCASTLVLSIRVKMHLSCLQTLKQQKMPTMPTYKKVRELYHLRVISSLGRISCSVQITLTASRRTTKKTHQSDEFFSWLRGQDSNLRPRGYEPRELTGLLHPAISCLIVTDVRNYCKQTH